MEKTVAQSACKAIQSFIKLTVIPMEVSVNCADYGKTHHDTNGPHGGQVGSD